MVVPDALDRVAQAPTLSEVTHLLSALQAAPGKEPWLVASFLTMLIGLGSCIWLAEAWRSYGIVLDRTGVRSLIALLLFVLLVAVPLAGLVWVATLV